MPLLDFLAEAVAVLRQSKAVEVGIGGLVRYVKQINGAAGLKPNRIVFAVQLPVALGDVVISAHLAPGDKSRVHEALEFIARNEAA